MDALEKESTEYSDTVYYSEDSTTCLKWKVDRWCCRGRIRCAVKDLDCGGSFGIFSKYFRIKIKGKSTLCHVIIWEMHNGIIPEGMFIDHINGNPKDNQISNLRCVSRRENSQNMRKRKNTFNIKTGVHLKSHNRSGSGFAAYWMDLNGKLRSKYFSISKYGIIESQVLASKYRDSQIKFLNDNGENYTDDHGKQIK